MTYASLCHPCRHLLSRHLLERGGDLRDGPYRCLDCECTVKQDSPLIPVTEAEVRRLEASGLPTYRTHPLSRTAS